MNAKNAVTTKLFCCSDKFIEAFWCVAKVSDEDVAKDFNVCMTFMKKVCRGHGIVRTEGLKYIDFLKVQSQRTKPALFNLTRDPHERNDLSENLAEALPRLQGLVDAFLAAPPRDYSKGDCVQEGGSCEGSATPYAPFPHMPVCMHAAPPPRRKGPRLAAPWKVKGGKEF